jgi:hypothetical protein
MTTLGEPIPLGIIHPEDFDRLGVQSPSVNQERGDLQRIHSQIAELRQTVSNLSAAVGRAVERHPLVSAAAISFVIWVILGLTARRMYRRF